MLKFTPSVRAAAAGTFCMALAVRLGWMCDLDRLPNAETLRAHSEAGTGRRLLPFVGHEDLLLRAFMGQPPDASSQAWPLPVALHQGLGFVFDDPRCMVVLSAVIGSLVAALVVRWVAEKYDPTTALWSGVFVALLGEHAAWSTSTYPVIHGHALMVAGLVTRHRGLSAGLLAVAAAFRPELAPLALFRGVSGVPAVLVAVAHIYCLPGPMLSSPLHAVSWNLPMLTYLGPPVLLAALLTVRVRQTWPLWLLVLLNHFWGSLFADYGARHALLGSVALCVLAAVCVKRTGPWLGLCIAAGLTLELSDLSAAWHTPVRPAASSADLPPLDGTCLEVSEEPPIAGQPIVSHMSVQVGSDPSQCYIWGEEDQHAAWTSRGLRDRAKRMRFWYTLSPVAQTTLGRSNRVRVYHRLEPRW